MALAPTLCNFYQKIQVHHLLHRYVLREHCKLPHLRYYNIPQWLESLTIVKKSQGLFFLQYVRAIFETKYHSERFQSQALDDVDKNKLMCLDSHFQHGFLTSNNWDLLYMIHFANFLSFFLVYLQLTIFFFFFKELTS